MTKLLLHETVGLVTGAGSGIGRATARRAAAEGAAVMVADIDGEKAASVAQLIRDAGGRAVSIPADVRSHADNEAMYDVAEREYGRLDFAFLNAGVLEPFGAFRDISLDVFDQMIGVNLRGAFIGMQLARARLRRGGSCLVTASAAGLIGMSEVAAYAASKHGVVGLGHRPINGIPRRAER